MFALLLLACSNSPGSAQSNPANGAPADSLLSADFIARQLQHEKKFHFINYRENFLQWKHFSDAEPLFSAFKNAYRRKVKVVHIGDSHVQADIYTGFLRNRLQELLGYGGRGMIFPYKAARTHAAYDYTTNSWGEWAYARNVQSKPKLRLGLSGVTIRTQDPKAGFNFKFNQWYKNTNNRVVRIYCDCTDSTYGLALRYNRHTSAQEAIQLHCPADSSNVIEVTLDEHITYLQLDMQQRDSTQNHFELYGISLESPQEHGILYHSVGINGATFQSILRQELMVEQLQSIAPDVIVIDLAGNEYYNAGLQRKQFESRLRNVIARAKVAAPRASIIVSCSQEFNKYRYHCVKDCKPAAEIARNVAMDTRCLFYDYYNVSGGMGAMNTWYQYRLSKFDRIHLSLAGYTLKAELLGNALLTTYHQMLRGVRSSPFAKDQLPQLAFKKVVPKRATVAASTPAVTAGSGNKVLYTVQPGDVLGTIAQRYGVGVSQIQAWNSLRGTMIKVGQRLVIYTNRSSGQVASSTSRPKSTAGSTPRASAARHIVRSGDTLWDIARKYGTTVDAICKLNNMNRNDRLEVGTNLRLR